MKKKIMKHKRIEENVLEILNGKTFEEVIELMNRIKDGWKEYNNFGFAIEYSWDDVELVIMADREETDKEFEQRMNRDKGIVKIKKKKDEQLKQKELAELDRLKKKYETNSNK